MTKKTTLRVLLGATALLLGMAASAQEFVVSTGGKGNTYSKMFNQFSAQCQNEVGVPFVERESTGSVENLDRLLANEVPAANVQVDVLHFRARNEDLSRIKALFALHPEEIHLVTTTATRKEGQTMGMGGKM